MPTLLEYRSAWLPRMFCGSNKTSGFHNIPIPLGQRPGYPTHVPSSTEYQCSLSNLPQLNTGLVAYSVIIIQQDVIVTKHAHPTCMHTGLVTNDMSGIQAWLPTPCQGPSRWSVLHNQPIPLGYRTGNPWRVWEQAGHQCYVAHSTLLGPGMATNSVFATQQDMCYITETSYLETGLVTHDVFGIQQNVSVTWCTHPLCYMPGYPPCAWDPARFQCSVTRSPNLNIGMVTYGVSGIQQDTSVT